MDNFAYREFNNGVEISRAGRVVTTLRGRAAMQFLTRVEHQSEAEQQRLMAAATGQYKFGNERSGKLKSR